VPRPGEPGDETWGGLPLEKRRHVGAWGPGSYDLEMNLLYWGTSIPSPSNEHIRGTPGANMLYTNSTLALDPDTGRVVWYFQHLPRDNWDLDHVYERILVDGEVRPDRASVWKSNPKVRPGSSRKMLTGIPGKTGIVWTLDRATGEFLWARETVRQNVIKDIDSRTGQVTVNEDVIPDSADGAFGLVCPSNKGGKVWQVGSYSPRTKAMYMPLQNMCMEPQTTTSNPSLPASSRTMPPSSWGRSSVVLGAWVKDRKAVFPKSWQEAATKPSEYLTKGVACPSEDGKFDALITWLIILWF
jgi:alcohol dehydrogenase (cytochrome c)